MRSLILAAGRFGDALRSEIAAGREPRLDVFEIANALDADVIDFGDVERSGNVAVQAALRGLGKSAAVAVAGFAERNRYDVVITTGEDIGLPFATMLAGGASRVAHAMIAHTLAPRKKRVFFRSRRVRARIDRMLVYSTSEERLAIDTLGMPVSSVQRISFHADEAFFRPDGRPTQPNLICAAGQLLRDYACLCDAVRDLPVRVEIAAGSPWIERPLDPHGTLPANVTWGKKNRFELREMYANSAFSVVPILQNHYQTGIATILEMMAMGKCVIATKTFGQTDTIVDGETGVYVPPSDPQALRAAIERLRADPESVARIGRAARRFVEERASLGLFVENIVAAAKTAYAVRGGAPA